MIYDTFYYNDKWLSDFNMKLFDAEDVQTFPTKEMISIDMNSESSKLKVLGSKFSDTLELKALICKDPDFYDEYEEMKFSSYDIRNIKSWLMSPKRTLELVPYTINQYTDNISYFGMFTDIQPFIVSGECYGLYITFVCDSPYGYSALYTQSYDMANRVSLSDVFENTSDEYEDYLYPEIKVYLSNYQESTLTIKNYSDNENYMTIKIPNCTEFTIDTYNMLVYDENKNALLLSDLGWDASEIFDYNNVGTGSYNLYWLRFVHGTNNLTFEIDKADVIEKIEISARFVRRADGF